MSIEFRNKLVSQLLSVLLVSSLAGAQSGNTIVGKVRRQSGLPLSNVLVQLETGNGVMITQTVTTNEGDYAFTGLEGASFVLVVNEPGHEPFSERVELARTAATRPGQTVRVDIMLSPNPRQSRQTAGTVFQQDVPEVALRAYRRGVKLLAEHKSGEGIALLEQATQALPNYFDAHFALALEFIRLHRHDDAIAELERARQANPRSSRLYHMFGLVLFEQKKFQLAARVFDAATRLDPTDAEAMLMRGASLIETGELAKAEQEIKRADSISSHKLAIVHLHLARIYEKRGDGARAADELEAYLRMNPGAGNADVIREAIRRLRAM